MSHGIGDFSTLCDENTKYFWPWMSSQGCPTCCFLGVLSLALVVSSHVCTMQLSLQGLPLKSQSILSLSLCPSVSLSLSLSPYSLSLQNSTIPLKLANSEISLLNLVRPPGSVWVSLLVLWPATSSQAGRWDTYKDDLIYFPFWASLSYTSWCPMSNKHHLIYLNLFSSFLRRS